MYRPFRFIDIRQVASLCYKLYKYKHFYLSIMKESPFWWTYDEAGHWSSRDTVRWGK